MKHQPIFAHIMRLALAAIVMLSITATQQLQGQNARLNRAERAYDAMMYPRAIRHYERGLRKTKDVRAMERLADAYRQVGLTAKAEQWYAEAVKQPAVSPIAKFHYGEMLKANGKYEEARKWFEAFLQTGTDPRRAARAVESCDYAIQAVRDSGMFIIKPERFNTPGSEFGAIPYQQGLLIAAERRGGCAKWLNLRNNNRFYDLYHVTSKSNKRGYQAKAIKGKVNRRYHEGPATLSNSQDRLFFTRSFMVKDRRSRSLRDHSKLKILTATRSGAKWKSIEEMPFNAQEYSVGHPALSQDGNTLVFASDIPGGFGGTDLYLTRKEGTQWSTPVNLGSAINTEGNESFPYLHDGGTLFFASDGHPGLGGLDIFSAAPDGQSWAQTQNLGYPLNSAADDFSMAWATNKANGWIASNRDGDDDIYTFRRGASVQVLVLDERTGLPVKDAKVRILNASNKESNFVTGPDGRFVYLGEWGKDFIYEAQADRYLEAKNRVTMSDLSPVQDKQVTIKLTPDLILMLTGQVIDAKTRKPLAGATVRLIGQSEEKLKTDAEGKYFKRLNENTEYTVVAMQPGYVPQVHHLSTKGKSQSEEFVFNPALEPGNYLLVEGRTFQNSDKAPIEAVSLHAVDDSTKQEVRATRSRQDGRFWQVLDPARASYMVGSKTGFFSARASLPEPKPGRDTTVWIDMPMFPYEVGTIVKIIYYDYNKSAIIDSASKDLYEIIYFLNENPEASVELSAHTDSRGGLTYNQTLSQQRAEAAVGFIVARGIDQSRIIAKGYGESKLMNKCADNVPCTDREHALNRRTEIKVIKIEPRSNP